MSIEKGYYWVKLPGSKDWEAGMVLESGWVFVCGDTEAYRWEELVDVARITPPIITGSSNLTSVNVGAN